MGFEGRAGSSDGIMNEVGRGHVKAGRRITWVIRERKMPVRSLYAEILSLGVFRGRCAGGGS